MRNGYKPFHKIRELSEVTLYMLGGRVLGDALYVQSSFLSSRIVSGGGTVYVRLETKCEVLDDPENLATNISQEQESWHPFHNLGLVNRYIKGEAHVLILFKCRKPGEFVACLHRDDWGIGRSEHHLTEIASGGADELRLSDRSGFFAWNQCAANRYGRYRQQQTMLVNDIQLMQLPKAVAPPSLIWLDTVENFVTILPKAWYFAARRPYVCFGCVEDWERRVLVGCPPSSNNQRIGEVVERASEIMDNIPQHEGQRIWDDWDALDVIDDLSRLVVVFSPDGVGIVPPERIDGGLEILDVLLGPIVFC
jgi:hypothetical protein